MALIGGSAGAKPRRFDPGQGLAATAVRVPGMSRNPSHSAPTCCVVTTSWGCATPYPTACSSTPASARANCAGRRGQQRRPDPAPAGLYVHVPFCESRFYCGCNRIITCDNAATFYPAGLYHGDRAGRALFRTATEVIQLHFWRRHAELPSPGNCRKLDALGRSQFRFSNTAAGRDVWIELDPRLSTRRLRRTGASRLSTAPASACRTSTRRCRKRSTASSRWSRPVMVVDACRRTACARSTSTSSTACPSRHRRKASRDAGHRDRDAPDRVGRLRLRAPCRTCSSPQKRIDTPYCRRLRRLEPMLAIEKLDGRRLHLHRHGPFRAARRRPCAGARRRHAAPQLHGLFDHADSDPSGSGVKAISQTSATASTEPAKDPCRAGRPRSTTAACRFPRGLRLDDDDGIRVT